MPGQRARDPQGTALVTTCTLSVPKGGIGVRGSPMCALLRAVAVPQAASPATSARAAAAAVKRAASGAGNGGASSFGEAVPLGSGGVTGDASTTDPTLELLERQPASEGDRVPLLFVHGLGHGAWCWENWLD